MGTKVCPGFPEEPERWRRDEPAGDRPGPAECLPCYVHRMLAAHDCDQDFRWVRCWQRAHRDRPELVGWLKRHGAWCDCEVLLNVYDLDADAPPRPCDHGPVNGR
ncbi:DUF2695 domain-containing protein [Fodinicola acaciae]|uniref:DUF2695 domain-containing protein n=1 Tax=Fodinicola acaciae TaxID=2681555 RepID=UPI0013D55DF1|nr:DUF2695 domain-containing protein [Fodinicola acaciae]